ncbi:MAG: CDGSH iron-sulfur domain-containing protein [Candidatus Neomarinimicrobiota bacterium]|jgi:CDGSH-type Zn-finger protein
MNKTNKNMPHLINGEKKTYAWCACGQSDSQPFCDRSHSNLENITPIIFKNNIEGTIALCGCKKTGNPPYCDGTHKNLKEIK